jgi:hypothetical protein
MPGPLGGKKPVVAAPHLVIFLTVVLLCFSCTASAQEHLNCKSWLQMISADRVAAAGAGTEAALAAVRPIVDALPVQDQAPFLSALHRCLSNGESALVGSLDALCAREPSAEFPAFRSVVDEATSKCSHEVSEHFLK